jgi:hypothetical protein
VEVERHGTGQAGRGGRVPHEVDIEVGAELDEELVHLAEVGGVAVGVEQRELGPGLAHVHRDHLGAPLRPQPPRLHVGPPRDALELDHHRAAALLLARQLGGGRGRGRRRRRRQRRQLHPVRRRARREEGEARRDRRGDGAHLGLGFAAGLGGGGEGGSWAERVDGFRFRLASWKLEGGSGRRREREERERERGRGGSGEPALSAVEPPRLWCRNCGCGIASCDGPVRVVFARGNEASRLGSRLKVETERGLSTLEQMPS